MKIRPIKKIIYLDYAATTPLDLKVEKGMRPFWSENFGNPSSLYSLGVKAKLAMNEARKAISRVLNSRPEEIIFTAGGTESVNLAVLGAVRNFARGSHIITSQIEHHSVLEAFKALEKEGYKATYLPVNSEGFIDIKNLQKAIRRQTVFISIMYANNEIGSIQPIAEVGKVIRMQNAKRRMQNLPEIIFHTDACQAAGYLDLNVQKLGVDLMSINGSKIYGPKQTGILFVKKGTVLKSQIFGGGQEKNLRSGTENVPGIVGLAKALQIVEKNKIHEINRLAVLRDNFTSKILKIIPKTFLNGPSVKNKSLNRLPNNINICFQGVDGEALILYLDAYGICASTGSACSNQASDASHVLLALGLNQAQAKSSIRFSLGRETSKRDLDFTVDVLKKLVILQKKIKSANI